MTWFKPSSVRRSDFPWATIELRMSDFYVPLSVFAITDYGICREK